MNQASVRRGAPDHYFLDSNRKNLLDLVHRNNAASIGQRHQLRLGGKLFNHHVIGLSASGRPDIHHYQLVTPQIVR